MLNENICKHATFLNAKTPFGHTHFIKIVVADGRLVFAEPKISTEIHLIPSTGKRQQHLAAQDLKIDLLWKVSFGTHLARFSLLTIEFAHWEMKNAKWPQMQWYCPNVTDIDLYGLFLVSTFLWQCANRQINNAGPWATFTIA